MLANGNLMLLSANALNGESDKETNSSAMTNARKTTKKDSLKN